MADTDQEIAPLIENKQQSEDHWEIDIPEEDIEPGLECCIYKVPERLREVNEKAYTPQLISIGPVHHGNGNLAKMERQKLRYLKKFRERTSKETLERFRSFIEENVKRIYRCYDEFEFEIKFEASEFVTMILKDAVFIIEFFLRSHEKKGDFLLNREWLSLALCVDLFLLENQLPFFVLEGLYHLAFGPSGFKKRSFFRLACKYFAIGEDLSNEMEIKHFTDLLRCMAVKYHPSESTEKIRLLYTATKLNEAGVDFKAVERTNFLLDLRFQKGELLIPSLHVGHGLEAMIRNVMALEQCHYPGKAYVCSYIRLLDHLIDTEKDVDLLVKKGIIVNAMGSSAAVADMINTLMVGVPRLPLPRCYGQIAKDLNQYYENFWNRTKATLRQVYFNNLWRGTATVAAFIVVLLTLIQTVLAILDRAMPTK